MTDPPQLPALAPPRGAAISGVVFGILTIVGLGLVRYAVPVDLKTSSSWLADRERRDAIQLAVDLVPFGGIAFLWFIGVLRNRLGELEDRFFATLFLGSGLLYIANSFVSAAVTAALLESVAAGNIDGDTYYVTSSIGNTLLNVFAMKMAAVFIFSTCTVGLRTGIFPRWIAQAGYVCAVVLLLTIANWKWIALIFPAWILLVSASILIAGFRVRRVPLARPAQGP